MKTVLRMFLLALLGTGVAVVSSCSKDASRQEEKVKTLVGDNIAVPEDELLEQQIKAFLQQCDFYAANPGMKTGAVLHKRDALWLLEAAMNYSYGFPHEYNSMFCVDSCLLLLPKAGGDSVAYADVAGCLQQLQDSVRCFYNRLIWPEKSLVLTDIRLSENPAAEEFLIGVRIITGMPDLPSEPFSNPYNTTDHWYYGGLAGKCGPYYPSFFGSDAAREIEKYQDWFSQVVPPGQGCHYYYTDIEQVIVQGNSFSYPDDPVPGDNWCDYLLFYNDPALPDYHQCLNPDEMWHYLTGLYHVVADPDKAPAVLSAPGKVFVNVTVTSCISLDNVLSHRACIRYGRRHVSCDPEYPKAPLAY